MPPEEQIARRILADAFQGYARGPLSSVREGELRDLIAAAIREAVAAEREACAALIGRRGQEAAGGFERAVDEGDEVYQEAEIETCVELAAAILARSEP